MATILMIDDDPDFILAVQMVLENAGHTFISASNGEEGYEVAKTQNPDLIILDVMMDTATAGFQLALKLRGPDAEDSLKRIPILMFSAIHETTPLRFTPDDEFLPVDDFLEKPVVPDMLLKKVTALLERSV
ncbi:MAG: response regulator transcription factor [Anaerolineales bacterium]|nr:response regulator transcription factor [Anaerolineales bacterium]